MTLSRILNFSKNFAYRNSRYFSSASITAVRYPIGKDPSSLPLALTQKLSQNPSCIIDERPISLRYRVNSMIELSQLDKAAEISRLAVLEEYRNSPDTITICNQIIGAMSGSKRYDEAIALFHYFFNESNLVPNIVSFNHIIKSHCEENRVDQALELYHHLRDLKLENNEDTYRFLTKGLVNSGRIDEAVGIVKEVSMLDSVVYSYLVGGFLDQGNYDKADELYDEFIQEVYDYEEIARVGAPFVDYWFRQGSYENAMVIYRAIIDTEDGQHTKSGNIFLKIFLEHGKQSEAWELFEEMRTNAKTYDDSNSTSLFDSETISMMVNECFKLGKFKEAIATFKLGSSSASSRRCYSNIIERFCERGMMSEAETLFEEMWSDKDLVLSYEVDTFRSMIIGYVKVGRMDDAQRMLTKMVDTNLLKVSIRQAD